MKLSDLLPLIEENCWVIIYKLGEVYYTNKKCIPDKFYNWHIVGINAIDDYLYLTIDY